MTEGSVIGKPSMDKPLMEKLWVMRIVLRDSPHETPN
jgi:hypothetical protein